jgi:hypothetical protein
MPALVQALFSNKAASGTSLVLSGSAVVSAGNTILVGIGTGASNNTGFAVTDNLGNTYSQVVGAVATVACTSRLFRGDVTKPGTLTTITVTQPTSVVIGAMAAEFSGVGVLRATGTIKEDNSAFTNSYPGGAAGTVANYLANDMWIGVAAAKASMTFTPTSGGAPNIGGVEPTQEQAQSALTVGWTYYVAGAGASGMRLAGSWSTFNQSVGAGAAFQPAPTGITNNDVVTGTVILTGTAFDQFFPPIIRNDAPTSAFKLSGTVAESNQVARIYTDAPTGTLALGGTCVSTHTKGYADNPTGKITLAGAAANASQRDATPVAIFRLSGSVSAPGKEYTDTCAGVLALIGVASQTLAYTDLQSGHLVFTGSAIDAHFIVASDDVAGTLALRGSNNEFIEIDGQIIHDDRPTAVMPISGRLITPGQRPDMGIGGLGSSSDTRLKGGRVVTSLTGRLRA